MGRKNEKRAEKRRLMFAENPDYVSPTALLIKHIDEKNTDEEITYPYIEEHQITCSQFNRPFVKIQQDLKTNGFQLDQDEKWGTVIVKVDFQKQDPEFFGLKLAKLLEEKLIKTHKRFSSDPALEKPPIEDYHRRQLVNDGMPGRPKEKRTTIFYNPNHCRLR